MAEVIGALTSINPALSVVFAVLHAAYTAYNGVQDRKSQLKVLLDRCKGMLLELDKSLEVKFTGSTMERHVRTLTKCVLVIHGTFSCSGLTQTRNRRAVEGVRDLVKRLASRGFVWCLLHSDQIDQSVVAAGVALTDAFQLFNVGTLL